MKKIFVEISRRCHKSCYYCYNNKKTDKEVRPDIKRIIESVIALAGDEKRLSPVFSGGEPVFSLDEIEKILLQLRESGYILYPVLITNTEHISTDFKEFIIRYKPYLVLSFNKKTKTLLNEFKLLCPQKNLFIRFTITPKNLDSVYKNIKVLTDKMYSVGISPAYGILWTDHSLQKLGRLYLELLNLRNIELIYDFHKILHTRDKNPELCNSLMTSNAVDIYGNIHSCHRAIYFPERDIQESQFREDCELCPAYRFCTPCIFKDIPGEGCKIRVAISPAYELLYNLRRSGMKKKAKISYKGKKYEIPETVLKKYTKGKRSPTKRNPRNFYELGESDCY